MNVLVIDNYDSFTYNLVQYLGELGAERRGAAQRRATWTSCSSASRTAWSCRPGPCTPDDAGLSMRAVRRFGEAGPRCWASASATSRSPRSSAAACRARRAGARQDGRDGARRQDDLRGARVARSWSVATTR